ncbi:MAG: hypothetical protein NTW32_18020 [Chloroflexi bacterium]|nr:hypothetical protein [Chloroflexota bacterium]
MNKKIFWACGVGILFGVIGLLAWRSELQSTNQTADQTVTATPGALSAEVRAIGSIRAAQSAALVWQTSGRVGTVNVKIGDKISADTALAALEQSSPPREVLLAGAELVAAQQALDSLTQSNLRIAQVRQTLADADQPG